MRSILAIAQSGDTVDLRALTCSQISLADHGLFTTLSDLTLAGLGQIISGPGQNYRVLTHVGHGTLSIEGLVFQGGQYDGSGGCIYSAGNVSLLRATISGCQGSQNGGGVYAAKMLRAEDSIIRSNTTSAHDGDAQGGGAFAGANLTLKHSTVSGNTALAGGGLASRGGGVFARGQVFIVSSTLSSNTAQSGGAAYFSNASTVYAQTILESTISGNSAQTVGGILARGDAHTVFVLGNSTVAFNTTLSATQSYCGHTAGVCALGGSMPNNRPGIESSIIADNVNAALSTSYADLFVTNAVTLSGSHNLIIAANQTLPDSLTQDPQLAPLADNGGHVLTHALPSTSPAINHGSAQGPYDERGQPRISGSAADIGAYELEVDMIFFDGFDTQSPL